MASKYDALSRIILQNVGGKANISTVTHCITRLRFNLKDEAKANTDVLNSTEGVVTVMQSGGQYQVVIGNHVPEVFKSLVAVGHLENLASSQTEDGSSAPVKMNPFDTFVNIVTNVFTPFLGVLCACGILKGILALFTAFGLLGGNSGTYNILYSLADSGFYFLPPILGYTAAKRFKLPEIEGLLIGLAMVYPYVLDAKAICSYAAVRELHKLSYSRNMRCGLRRMVREPLQETHSRHNKVIRHSVNHNVSNFRAYDADYRPGSVSNLKRTLLLVQLAVFREPCHYVRDSRSFLACAGDIRPALVISAYSDD